MNSVSTYFVTCNFLDSKKLSTFYINSKIEKPGKTGVISDLLGHSRLTLKISFVLNKIVYDLYENDGH